MIQDIVREKIPFEHNSSANGSCYEFSYNYNRNISDFLKQTCESMKSGTSLIISNAYSCPLNQFINSFTNFFNIPSINFPSECDEGDWSKIIFNVLNRLNATDFFLIYDKMAGKFFKKKNTNFLNFFHSFFLSYLKKKKN